MPAQSQNGIFIQRCKDATTRQNLSHARLKVHRENERLQLFNSLIQEVGHEHGCRREDSGQSLGGTRAVAAIEITLRVVAPEVAHTVASIPLRTHLLIALVALVAPH